MAKKSPQSQAKQAVKKAIKKNPKGFIIALIAIVLILTIAVMVVYFAFPNIWTEIANKIINKNSNNNQIKPSPGPNHSDGTLTIEFVDVGQGDCQIIIFPDGKTMMIDGGDTGAADEVIAAMDSLSITKLDYVLLTHTDSDHCGALDDAINHATYVENIYLPKIKSNDYDLGLSSSYKLKDTGVYNKFVKAAKEATYLDTNSTIKSAKLIFTEDIIIIEDSAQTYKFTMYCRNDAYYKSMDTKDAHDLNDVSPICTLEFNNRIAIFAGDANNSTIETSSEKNFLTKIKELGYTDATFDADILKVPHHGGKDSSGTDFLDFIDVEYAVICVGGSQGTIDKDHSEYALYINDTFASATDYNIVENSKYSHPRHEVCAEGGRLDEYGVQYAYYTWFNSDIICTIDQNGTITFTCDKTATLSGSSVEYK